MKRQVNRQLLHTHIFRKIIFHVFLLSIAGAFLIGISGCKGKTINPTMPAVDTPTPGPDPTATPDDGELTPTPEAEGCDNYGETPEDPNLIVLLPDEEPVTVRMDCTGDIDWYKIEIPRPPVTLKIELKNLPGNSDYDLIAYDENLLEMENGRSAQTGSVDEQLSLYVPDFMIYLQIHSYNGKGTATLEISIEDDSPVEPGDGDDDDDDGDNDDDNGDEFEQRSYEEILFQELSSYPRGTMNSLLERSVETIVTKSVFCQLTDSQLTGAFTIGNYAHVERDFFQSVDYIDGWSLVVFNGSKALLTNLTLTIRVTLYAPDIDLEVEVPYSMEIDGNDYLTSTSENDVYYISWKYGDLSGNSSSDIRITSGVVGDIGDLFANNIFTQQVEVGWEYEGEIGGYCSGRVSGRSIVDFAALSIR